MPIRSCSRGSNLRSLRALAALLLLVLPANAASVVLPPAGALYDSQLGGAYPPPAGVAIVSRDRAAPAAAGLHNICYINAFRTQPQETVWWTENHPDLLLTDASGNYVEDPNWPGEILLDTSTAAKRDGLFAIVQQWIAGCADAGYQAIEADNLDTYSRSNDALSVEDNLAYAKALSDYAHSLGLAFGQKNSGELGGRGKAAGFDFAIVESCQVYDECGDYIAVYGRHVLEIEYTDTDAKFFEMACAAHGEKISVVRRDRNLTMAGEKSYFYQTC